MNGKSIVTLLAVGALLPLIGGGGWAFAAGSDTTRPVPASTLTDGPVLLPPSPIALARSAAPTVRAWLDSWLASELKGQNTSAEQIEAAGRLLKESDTPLDQAAQIAQLIAALDGNSAAAPLYPIVVDRAEKELMPRPGDDPDSRRVAAILWPMHQIFWDLEDREADVRFVHALLPFEIRGSGHSQWANYTFAELLYFLNRYSEAYNAFLAVKAEREVAFERSEGVNRPLNWEMGLTAAGAGKHLEAAGYFQAASQQPDFPSAQAASASEFMELYAAGKHDEAIAKFKEHVIRYKLTQEEARDLASRLSTSSTVR